MTQKMTAAKALESSDIFEEIQAQPPLMRQEIRDTFIGKEVEWLLTFANGSVSRGQAEVYFNAGPRDSGMVAGTASLAEYPWLKSLRVGEAVRVHGRINCVQALMIDLDILELSIPETATLRG